MKWSGAERSAAKWSEEKRREMVSGETDATGLNGTERNGMRYIHTSTRENGRMTQRAKESYTNADYPKLPFATLPLR